VTSLEELTRIVPAPSVTVDGSGSWDSTETRLGTGLPSDYKAYIEMYGTGRLDGFIWVLNPFSRNPNLNLMTKGDAALRTLRELQSKHECEVPYPLYPEAGGLLPWGITDNGDVLYWLTAGEPKEWPVVLNAARDARTERHEGGMAAFLVRVLSADVVSGIFPTDFPGEMHSFE
jgi:hypothetical protein